jgi:DNA-binding response OmpR family regulator
MARILSVSYDETLLRTRASLLQHEGYDVISVQGFVEGLEKCKQGGFDLFILGHSIPHKDKQQLVQTFRQSCRAPVISLLRNCDAPLGSADLHVEPEPRKLLQAIAEMLQH